MKECFQVFEYNIYFGWIEMVHDKLKMTNAIAGDSN